MPGVPCKGAGVAGNVNDAFRRKVLNPLHDLQRAAACRIQQQPVAAILEPPFAAIDPGQVGGQEFRIADGISRGIVAGAFDLPLLPFNANNVLRMPCQRQREVANATKKVEDPVRGIKLQQVNGGSNHLLVDRRIHLHEVRRHELDLHIELRAARSATLDGGTGFEAVN